jgi:hypothetical protein
MSAHELMIINAHKAFHVTSVLSYFIAALLVIGGAPVVFAQEKEANFAGVLVSQDASPQIPASERKTFDWLIGDCEADVYEYGPARAKHTSKGEWHFSWVIEGRAIQDVWIVPKRSARMATTPLKIIVMALRFESMTLASNTRPASKCICEAIDSDPQLCQFP